MQVKGNQSNLQKAIQETEEEAWSIPFSTTELNRGRIETRTIKVSTLAINELDFPGSRSIALVKRDSINKKTGNKSSETTAYISNLINPTPKELLNIIRLHWCIENSLHYKKDVVYREDSQTMHKKNGPFNMSVMRSFAISCASLAGFTLLPDAIHKFANATRFLLHGLQCTARFAEG